jgi:hypothetical protein
MRRESLCCLGQRYVTATFDCKQRQAHDPPKLALGQKVYSRRMIRGRTRPGDKLMRSSTNESATST